MGVDYTANYGIGVKLVDVTFDESKGFEDMSEYLEDLPEASDIVVQYFSVGSESYGGDPDEYYLCIKDPMEDGVEELAKKIDIFKLYLKEFNVDYIGEIDLVGGLRIQ